MQASMGLSIDTCRQLWQVWDELMQQMPPLLARKAAQEREIEAILSMMDHSGHAPYVDLLQKGWLPHQTRCMTCGEQQSMQNGGFALWGDVLLVLAGEWTCCAVLAVTCD